MKKSCLLIELAFILLALCACDRTSSEQTEKPREISGGQHTNPLPDFTQESLAELIPIGMSTDALIATLGVPTEKATTNNGYIYFTYSFQTPNTPGPRKFVVSGIIVYLKNDKVVRWEPAEYGSVGGFRAGDQPMPVEPKSGSGTQPTTAAELSFWSVSKTPVAGWRFIDTAQMPKLGYIGMEPSLRLRRLVSLRQGREITSDSRGKEIETPTFHFQLSDEDSGKFYELCQQNLGKNILIMVEDIPIGSPKIVFPIANGRFQIALDEGQGFENVRDKLATLVQPK